MAKTCKFIKPNGKRCKAYPMSNSHYCFSHNPKTKAAKAEAVLNGGFARKKKKLNLKPLKDLDNAKGIIKLLTQTINLVRSDGIASKEAQVLGYLAEKLTKVLEVSEYETRMRQIEKILDGRRS